MSRPASPSVAGDAHPPASASGEPRPRTQSRLARRRSGAACSGDAARMSHDERTPGGRVITRSRLVIVALAAASVTLAAGGAANARRRGERRPRRHQRRRHRTERPRGGGVGDRRDERPAHEVRAHRRDRRSGPVPHPGSSEGELQRVGARLRARGLAEVVIDDRADARAQGRAGAERARRGGDTIRPATGTRCSRCRRSPSSRAPDRRATASRRT